MAKKYYIAIFCICLGAYALAQTTLGVDPEVLIANLYRQQQTATIAYDDFYESLYQFYLQKLDLNTATVEELRSLYVLTDKQIQDLEQHIRVNGPLISLYELQSIEGYEVEVIKSIAPFVVVKSEDNTVRGLRKFLKKPDAHYLILRQSADIERAKGYKTNSEGTKPYQGDPNQIYLRYRFQKFKKFSVGITAEKDAGEAFAWNAQNKQYGTDFFSLHAMVYNVGKIKRWVVGDYQVQFGQGLVLSGGFFLGKGSETILSVRRNTVGIRPYTSLLETNYMRGTAVTFGGKRLDFTPFVSYKFIDGSLQTGDTISDDDLAILRYTGLHRTATELASRANVSEALLGSNIHYSSLNKKFQMGVNGLYVKYSKYLQSADRVYNLYEFKGADNHNVSAYYSYYWRNLSFFGEAAISKSRGKGLVQGLLLSLGSKVDASLVYRHFSPQLHTPYGNAFGENFKNSNEEGLYWGMKIRLSTKTELSAYYDLFRFPWLKYRVSAPSVGHEYMVSLLHKFNKKTIATLQYRHESKEKDTYIKSIEPYLVFHQRTNYMLQLEYKADKHWYMRSRVQGSFYKQLDSLTTGFLAEQDLGYDGRKFDVSVRAALFETGDFNNRQYAYEKDVLYSFSFPFFSGKGMRNYILIRYNLTKNISLWAKYGRTTYFERQTVGSGNEQTEGNIRSEFKWQCRYTF